MTVSSSFLLSDTTADGPMHGSRLADLSKAVAPRLVASALQPAFTTEDTKLKDIYPRICTQLEPVKAKPN